jgi:hypothetical protein
MHERGFCRKTMVPKIVWSRRDVSGIMSGYALVKTWVYNRSRAWNGEEGSVSMAVLSRRHASCISGSSCLGSSMNFTDVAAKIKRPDAICANVLISSLEGQVLSS